MPSDLQGAPVGGIVEELLNEFFINDIRPDGYKRYRGVLMPVSFEKHAEQMENFEVRDDDVWVMSYPKTGTTWTQEMVWCIGNDLNYEKAKQIISERFPFFDHSSILDYRNVLAKHPEMKLPLFVTDAVGNLDRMKERRFIKTHLPWVLLPQQIRSGEKTPKIIYVCRNPKDTLISYYHHCILLEGYTGDFDTFFTLFIEDALPFSPYLDHVSGFWSKRNLPNVLFLTYEQLKKDLPGCVKQTADFLDKELTEEESRVLCDHLSFSSMKNNNAVNYEPVLELNRAYNLLPKKGEFMRKGTGGEWKSKFTQEQIDKMDNWIQVRSKELGIEDVWEN